MRHGERGWAQPARAAAAILAAGCIAVSTAGSTGAAGNPIQTENAQPGTTSWQPRYDTLSSADQHALEGYSTNVSLLPGDTLSLHVSTSPAARYRIEVYRLGWYGGAGGRLVGCVPSCGSDEQGTAYPVPSLDANGFVDAGWPVTDTFVLPADAVSGYYAAKLVLTSGPLAGGTRIIPLIVREAPGRHATALVVAPVNTWQAYNPWGGKSLYDFQSTNGIAAVKVSFHRPFHPAHTPLEYDLDLVRWLERNGYDVSYTTDVDVAQNPASLLDHTLVITAGHDEYWTKEERDAFEAARAAGVNLAFMGANTGYWQARLEDGGSTLVEYRSASADPVTDPSLDTILFRDLVPPRPECTLLGVEYNGGSLSGIPNYDLPVDPTGFGHPWFAGTGFASTSVVQQAVGYEWDQVVSGCTPPGSQLTTLFHYPGGQPADTVTYAAPSGAIVFSAGSLGIDTALDNYSAGVQDTRFQQFMRNAMFDLMVSHTGAPSVPAVSSPPSVSGQAVVGSTLTTTTGSWSGAPTSYAYQWRRCDGSGASCTDVGGATSSSYTVQAGDAGATLRARVTASNGAGPSSPADSAATAVVVASGGGGSSGSFGATTPGALSGAPGAGYEFGGPYALPADGTATRFDFYTRGGSAPQTFVPAVYTSSGGAPDRLVVTGTAVTVAAGQTAGWVSATLPSTPLAAGTYYLVLLSQATSSSAFIYYDAAPSAEGVYTTNPGSTPTAVFGPASTEARRWSYRVQVGSAGPPPPPPSPPANTALPTISGTAQQGQTLTATTGTWTNAPTSYSIVWQRCSAPTTCSDIGGATGATYVLQQADVGATLRVGVSAANAGGTGGPVFSSATNTVTAAPAPSGTFGAAGAGSTTAAPGAGYKFGTAYALTSAAVATRFDFYARGGTAAQSFTPAIYASSGGAPTSLLAVGTTVTVPAGAAPGWISSTLPATSLQAGTYYLVLLSGTAANAASIYYDTGGATDGVYNANPGSAPTSTFGAVSTEPRRWSYRVAVGTTGPPPPLPVATTAPAISGTAQQGQTLTASTGSWTGSPTSYAYQWRRCDSTGAVCGDIGGATSAGYLLQQGDVGATIRVRVTAANAGGPGNPADSAATTVVSAAPATAPANTLAPAVSGTPRPGQTLTATPGTWTGAPTSYAYQWRRCDAGGGGCSDVAGAASSIYTVTSADLGSTLRVRVSATNAGGTTSADSAASPVVSTSVELAPDPSFEADPSASYTTNGAATFTWATDQWHSASHSLKVVSSSAGLVRWLTLNGSITVTAGTTYSLSAWLRTSIVPGSARVTVTFWNASNVFLDSADSTALDGTTGWQQVGVTKAAPAGAAWARIEIRLTDPGTMWADDVSFTAGST